MAQPGPPPVASDGLTASDPLTDFFWAGAREGRLMIQRCQACGTYIHLPRPVCRACRSFDLAPEQVSGRGTVYTFTETHRPFHPFFVDRVPYLLAAVELEEQAGLRVLSNLVGMDEPAGRLDGGPRIGMAVEVDFEWLSDDLAVPVFRPASGSTT
jgi:uncharacterized OB-fold protein